MQLVIDARGKIRYLYDETVDLVQLGRITISRGSYVEPDSTGQWSADLSPTGGPKLGPFDRRSEALAAEARWLCDHWLVPGAET